MSNVSDERLRELIEEADFDITHASKHWEEATLLTEQDILAALRECLAGRSRIAELEKDAGRYQYAKANLRIGKTMFDGMGDCCCDFADWDDAAIDSGIYAARKEGTP